MQRANLIAERQKAQ